MGFAGYRGEREGAKMTQNKLTHFSLFSGIGGIDLAAEWAGFQTVGQCEFADYPTKILEKHWPDVVKWRDIRDVTADSFYERTGLRTVDIISGGFPCQPFSVAGKQKGKGDDRYLWPEMLRVIRELGPRWVVGENVPGIIKIAGRTVCEDLERAGYAVAVFNFEAAAVGAKHRRERVFFVGHSEHDGHITEPELRSNETASREWWKKKQTTAGEFEGASRSVDVSSIRRSKSGSKRDDVADAKSKQQSELQKCNNRGVDRRETQVRHGFRTSGGGIGGHIAEGDSEPRGIAAEVSKAMADINEQGLQICGYEPREQTFPEGNRIEHGGKDVPHSDGEGLQGRENTGIERREGQESADQQFSGRHPSRDNWSTQSRLGRVVDGISPRLDDNRWRVEPDIPRVATGIKNRVDRIKCLGNAVVPQQIYPIFKAIFEVENEQRKTNQLGI